jgi:hypothetical protein
MPVFDTSPTGVTRPTWKQMLRGVQPRDRNGTSGSGIFRKAKRKAPKIVDGPRRT